MCTKSDINKIMSAISKKTKEIFGKKLTSVILYGSYARDDYDEDSDIDVMVIADIDKSQIVEYESILSDFTLNIDLEFNIVLSLIIQDKATFNRWKDTSAFFKNIVKEGKIYAA